MISRHIVAIIFMLALLIGVAACQSHAALTFYVATNGNDQWSGKLAAPNDGRTDGPFATIIRARDAIREVKGQGALTQPVTVFLRGGIYFLSEPFVLLPRDSGAADAPITYEAYQNEKPVLSGGVAITGWHSARVNGRDGWATTVPDVASGASYFKQLFVDDQRRPRTRLPDEGLYRFAGLLRPARDFMFDQGQDTVVFANDDIRDWRNLGDVEVIALHFWTEEHLPVAGVDTLTHQVTFTHPSLYRLTDGNRPNGARYYVENVFEALDKPGQWYLERNGTLYYLPKPGEEPAGVTVIAPRLQQVVRFEGDPDKQLFVEHINLRGISFTHTEWSYGNAATSIQAAIDVPAAILWQAARDCTLRNCTIAHVGTYGIELGPGCDRNQLVGNAFYDLGAGAVKLAAGSATSTVSDNQVFEGGQVFPSAVGIWVGNSAHNEVTHNLIHRFPYTGISVGWTWAYKPSPAEDNHIEYNVVHHIGLGLLDDLGAIYTLGIQPGTTIRNNLVHDVWSANGQARGIYLDAGSSEMVIENNVVLRTDDVALMENFGRDNQIRNNIFALGHQAQVKRAVAQSYRAFTVERNIVYFTDGGVLAGQFSDGNYAFDYNVYFNAKGRPVTFMGASFAQWQASGQDAHSVVADPHLLGLEQDLVTVAPDSPAFSLGFKAIDLSQVGPRPGGAPVPTE